MLMQACLSLKLNHCMPQSNSALIVNAVTQIYKSIIKPTLFHPNFHSWWCDSFGFVNGLQAHSIYCIISEGLQGYAKMLWFISIFQIFNFYWSCISFFGNIIRDVCDVPFWQFLLIVYKHCVLVNLSLFPVVGFRFIPNSFSIMYG